MSKRMLVILASLIAAVALAACGGDDKKTSTSTDTGAKTTTGTGTSGGNVIEKNPANEGKSVTIGSKNFGEQFILGEIYAQSLEAAGYTVKKELNLGSEQIALKAVKSGQVDAYPEYTGTALTSFFKFKATDVPHDPDQAFAETVKGFAKEGLTALPHTPFTNSNAVAMTKKRAGELGVKTISDLTDKAKDLTFTGTPECRQRPDCLVGLQETYGLKFKKFTPVDPALRHKVLESGQYDVGIVFSTDAQIAQGKLVILEDDKQLFPPYNVTLVFNSKVLGALGPDARETIDLVQKGLTVEAMQELNSRFDLDKQKPAKIAADYLRESGYVK
jgi:glycine betaine/choline ABC-type transport system substrate-binding protein